GSHHTSTGRSLGFYLKYLRCHKNTAVLRLYAVGFRLERMPLILTSGRRAKPLVYLWAANRLVSSRQCWIRWSAKLTGALRMLLAAVILLLLALLPSQVCAQARTALLIGNQAYTPKVGVLRNPHEDVALVGAALKRLGFQVTILKDAGYRDLDIAIKRFIADVRSKGRGAISFFYYSGHGAANPDTQINYLIPVDAAAPTPRPWQLRSSSRASRRSMALAAGPDKFRAVRQGYK